MLVSIWQHSICKKSCTSSNLNVLYFQTFTTRLIPSPNPRTHPKFSAHPYNSHSLLSPFAPRRLPNPTVSFCLYILLLPLYSALRPLLPSRVRSIIRAGGGGENFGVGGSHLGAKDEGWEAREGAVRGGAAAQRRQEGWGAGARGAERRGLRLRQAQVAKLRNATNIPPTWLVAFADRSILSPSLRIPR